MEVNSRLTEVVVATGGNIGLLPFRDMMMEEEDLATEEVDLAAEVADEVGDADVGVSMTLVVVEEGHPSHHLDSGGEEEEGVVTSDDRLRLREMTMAAVAAITSETKEVWAGNPKAHGLLAS